VFKIAHKWASPNRQDLDDLVQEGFLGLLEAFQRFDPTMGVSFFTYAYPWVVKFVRMASRENGVIRVPSHITDIRRKVQKTVDAFRMKHGRQPTIEEVGEITQLNVHRIEQVLNPISLVYDRMPNVVHNSTAPTMLPDSFTDEEYTVVFMRLEGLDNTEICQKLSLSKHALQSLTATIERKAQELL
jgi:RNA polymerase sigma-B factor